MAAARAAGRRGRRRGRRRAGRRSPPSSPALCTVDTTLECTNQRFPVCGANGITYESECHAVAACQSDYTPGTCCKDKKNKCKVKKCNKRKMFEKNCQATCAAHCLEKPEEKKCPKEHKKCSKGKKVDCTDKNKNPNT